jgi:magnesium transporter
MIAAASLGSFLPMIFDRFKIDPAFATGPFATTIVDLICIFIYFELASLIQCIHGAF